MRFPFFKRKEKSAAAEPRKTALVLGGGGARGFAHLGAIQAFEEEHIDFDFCVGTSVGSLIGALYCAGVKTKELIPYCAELDLRDVHGGLFFRPNDPAKIGRIVTRFLGDALLEDLPKPFCAVAVDLVEGKQVLLDKGRVAVAVAASCCVPGLFRPVVRGKQHLADGGLLNNIPAETAKMLGAQKVVSIDINPGRGGGTDKLGMLEVLKASFRIMSANASLAGLRYSDIVIAPDTGKFSSAKKDGYEEMIELGYRAAKEQIPAIRAMMQSIKQEKP